MGRERPREALRLAEVVGRVGEDEIEDAVGEAPHRGDAIGPDEPRILGRRPRQRVPRHGAMNDEDRFREDDRSIRSSDAGIDHPDIFGNACSQRIHAVVRRSRGVRAYLFISRSEGTVVARWAAFPECSASGRTEAEAIENARAAIRAWVEAANARTEAENVGKEIHVVEV